MITSHILATALALKKIGWSKNSVSDAIASKFDLTKLTS